jgi:hypothetical protein
VDLEGLRAGEPAQPAPAPHGAQRAPAGAAGRLRARLAGPARGRLLAQLYSGIKAIKWRKLRNAFFTNASKLSNRSSDSDATHAHFVKVLERTHWMLKSWYNKLVLSGCMNTNDEDDDNDSVGTSNKCSNRYEVLSDSDLNDFVDISDDLLFAATNSSSTKSTIGKLSGSSNKLVDDSFDMQTMTDFSIDGIDEGESKVKTIILCFMLDMSNLLKKVKEAWTGVRADETHIIVAVSITVAAIKMLDQIFVEMQLYLPTIGENAATFLINVCGEYLSPAKIGDCPLSKLYLKLVLYLKMLHTFSSSVLKPPLDINTDTIFAESGLPDNRRRFIEQYFLFDIDNSNQVHDF